MISMARSKDIADLEDKSTSTEEEKKLKIPDFPKPIKIFFAILANLITTLNFASGVTAIILVSIDPRNVDYVLWGSRLILLAIIFDFSDGIPARLAKKEPGFFGIVVDSAADTVSFGLAPAVMIALSLPILNPGSTALLALGISSIVVGLYFGSCTIYRLIRFTKAPSKKWFKGIPAPGAGCAAAVYFIIKLYIENKVGSTLVVPIVGLLIMIFTATMMIVNFKYPTTKLRKNFLEVFLLGLTAVVIVSLVFVPLGFIIYPAAILAALTCLYVFYGPFYLLKHMLERAQEVNDY